MRRALLVMACLASACDAETEVMLVIKAARTLSVGGGQQVDALTVKVQPASYDALSFTLARQIDLCAVELAGTPGCRPEPYASQQDSVPLSLPLRILIRPGPDVPTEQVRVFVSAQQTTEPAPGTKQTVTRLSNHFQLGFVPHRRLWLEVPLYAECLDKHLCEDVNLICKADCPPRADGSVPATCCDTLAPSFEEGTDPTLAPDLADPLPDLALPPPVCGLRDNDECCASGPPCPGPNLACTNGFCHPAGQICGGRGQACCPSGDLCKSTDLACSDPASPAASTCELACGGPGAPCCETLSNACTPGLGLYCFLENGTQSQSQSDRAGGLCDTCGQADGARCCPRANASTNGSCFGTDLLCDGAKGRDFRCVTCGGAVGAPCCPNAPSCRAPLSLACHPSTNRCVDCGAGGSPCCLEAQQPTQFCSAPLNSCQGGLCVGCGSEMKPCCAGGTCPATSVSQELYCTGGMLCALCGNSGQRCCDHQGTLVCNDGSICNELMSLPWGPADPHSSQVNSTCN